jgi:hypothetical protein
MKIKITPFGEIEKERLELSRKYNLAEMTAGFWRLTSKCKKNYDSISYIEYLQGKVEKPIKKDKNAVIKGLLDM